MTKAKLKIYLDTSIVSAYFDERNPERCELTQSFFAILDMYDIFISDITLDEINQTPDIILREKMLSI
jgi:predicted nucleic acid-binding protein